MMLEYLQKTISNKISFVLAGKEKMGVGEGGV